MPQQAYAAFECTPEIRLMGENLIYEVERGNWRQHEALITLMARFDDEIVDAFVFRSLEAMGLGPKTRDIAQKAVDTLKSTSQKLTRQIAPKFDETIMRGVSDHIKDVTLVLPGPTTPRHFIGVRASAELDALRQDVVTRIRAGRHENISPDLTRLLNGVVDLLLEEFYMKQIRLMDLGFVTRKLIDGGVAIGRSVQHQLIKWVVPTLDAASLARMADYTDNVTLHLDAHPPFRYIYHASVITPREPLPTN